MRRLGVAPLVVCVVVVGGGVRALSGRAGAAASGPTIYSQVSAGDFHSCALTTDGTGVCWGYNKYGETQVPPGRYSAISAGSFHSCALTTDGRGICWGNGHQG